MDIFSLGCVIYEMITDGKQLFTLSMLLDYRAGKLDPTELLEAVADVQIRALIKHMINVVPEQRWSAQRYLTEFSGKVFPTAFANVLHGYMLTFVSGEPLTPDQKVTRLLASFGSLQAELEVSRTESELDGRTCCYLMLGSLVTACWRSLNCTTAKLSGLELLERISSLVADEYIVDRYVPFITAFLSDEVASVRARALRTLACVVRGVKRVRAGDLNLFPAYIFPHVAPCKTDVEISVRASVAPPSSARWCTPLCVPFDLGHCSTRCLRLCEVKFLLCACVRACMRMCVCTHVCVHACAHMFTLCACACACACTCLWWTGRFCGSVSASGRIVV
jgi:phosphoinositide-3-kinase regulatory subunit 4